MVYANMFDTSYFLVRFVNSVVVKFHRTTTGWADCVLSRKEPNV